MIAPFRSWYPPPKVLTLGSDEVHVWRASLDLPASRVRGLLQTLAADERARAERFYFQKDREHFIVARGVLRDILGRYLDMQPGQLRFCYSPNGKPALARKSGGDALRFNLSHSHGLALYAFTCGREIGVDIERIRTDFPCEQIAKRFFSPQEYAVFHTLPDSLKQEAFFTFWTCKEAYLKARGDGLLLPLNQFEVSLEKGGTEPVTVLNTKGDSHEDSPWTLHKLPFCPGYVAALVVEGHELQLKYWQWTEE